MATFKLELYKGKTLADGRHPICIRVTHNGATKRKTIASAFEHEWEIPKNGDQHPRIKPRSRKDHELLNREISDLYDKYRDNFKKLRDSGRPWKPADVFEDQAPEPTTLFQDNALAYLSTLEARSEHSHLSAKSRYEKIMRYTGGKDFDIDSITQKWLAGFANHCRTKEKNKTGELGNSHNTIMYAIKFIKRVASFAGVHNDVLKKQKLSFLESDIEYLTREEFQKVWALDLPVNENKWHARNFFSLAIYLRGIRVGDLVQLEFSDIKEGRIVYEANKTGKAYDIGLIPQAIEILEQYKGAARQYVFPFFRWRPKPNLSEQDNKKEKAREIKTATANINKNLYAISEKAGLGKRISTHKARHSFAEWSDTTLGGDLKVVQALLGHGTRAMSERYVKRIRKTSVLDQAAAQVFGISENDE